MREPPLLPAEAAGVLPLCETVDRSAADATPWPHPGQPAFAIEERVLQRAQNMQCDKDQQYFPTFMMQADNRFAQFRVAGHGKQRPIEQAEERETPPK